MNANFKTGPVGKRLLQWVGAAAVAVMFSGAAMAAGITGTKHNLSSTGTNSSGKSSTDQICVFCHTPHGADTTAAVPLWNKKLTPGAAYVTYDALGTSSLDGKVLGVGSVSLACLSCHDGTQAMDNMINAPGSGGFDSAGARFGTWTGGAGGGIIGDATNPIPRLGLDLRNDHPIGIEYCGGGITGTGTSVAGSCTDEDFKTPVTASINGSQVFWVNTDANLARSKVDIQLYNREFTTGNWGPSVECGSCHDPHVESSSSGVNFMRVSTAGSAICLSCHVK